MKAADIKAKANTAECNRIKEELYHLSEPDANKKRSLLPSYRFSPEDNEARALGCDEEC